jgi:hypothetical protein
MTPGELRRLADQAVTEGVNLRYVERLRQAAYAAADALAAAEAECLRADKAMVRWDALMDFIAESPS